MDVSWEQIQPYVDRHRFVNEIDEKVTVYQLNTRGQKRAEWIFYRRGQSPRPTCGVAIQKRLWPEGATTDHDFDDLTQAIDQLDAQTEAPITQEDHPQGVLVRMMDFPATKTALRRSIGWERHQAYGDDLSGPEVLIWMWRHVFVDYHPPSPYQEVLLWQT